MTHPAVDKLPQDALYTLLGICEQLAKSRHANLARWGSWVSDALLVQLMSVLNSARYDVVDFEPCGPLSLLDTYELDGLQAVMIASSVASPDDAVVDWCTRMSGLVDAESYRRLLIQNAIDAKSEAIIAEERRLACVAGKTRASSDRRSGSRLGSRPK